MSVKPLPQIKADLARLGVSVADNAQVVMTPPLSVNNKKAVVMLDRCADLPEPTYRIHGFTTCVACAEYVYLGSQSLSWIAHGLAWPLCIPCGSRLVPKDHPGRTGQLKDD